MVRLTESSEYNAGKLTNSTKLELSAGFDAETSAALTDVEHTFDSKLEFLVSLERCVYTALTDFCKERLHGAVEEAKEMTKDSKKSFDEITEGVVRTEEFYDDEEN